MTTMEQKAGGVVAAAPVADALEGGLPRRRTATVSRQRSEPGQAGGGGAGLDLLGRCRHGELCLDPQGAE